MFNLLFTYVNCHNVTVSLNIKIPLVFVSDAMVKYKVRGEAEETIENRS